MIDMDSRRYFKDEVKNNTILSGKDGSSVEIQHNNEQNSNEPTCNKEQGKNNLTKDNLEKMTQKAKQNNFNIIESYLKESLSLLYIVKLGNTAELYELDECVDSARRCFNLISNMMSSDR